MQFTRWLWSCCTATSDITVIISPARHTASLLPNSYFNSIITHIMQGNVMFCYKALLPRETGGPWYKQVHDAGLLNYEHSNSLEKWKGLSLGWIVLFLCLLCSLVLHQRCSLLTDWICWLIVGFIFSGGSSLSDRHTFFIKGCCLQRYAVFIAKQCGDSEAEGANNSFSDDSDSVWKDVQRYEGRSTIKGLQLKSSSTEGRLMAVIIWHTFFEIPNTSLLSTCILVYIAGLVNSITWPIVGDLSHLSSMPL